MKPADNKNNEDTTRIFVFVLIVKCLCILKGHLRHIQDIQCHHAGIRASGYHRCDMLR